jgi:two-component system sensor histidine kinase HydH
VKYGRYLSVAALFALPLVLLLSSWLTFRELEQLKGVYLRDRAAMLAARLETMPEAQFAEAAAEEPALLGLRIYDDGETGADAAALEPIWRGEALFRTENLSGVFRAYVPFHSGTRLRVARIDLASAAADQLSANARRNVKASTGAAFVLLALSFYVLWSARRSERLQKRQLELEHLAHLGKMSAVLAHEIRNPLATIKGFSQLAAEKADAQVRAMVDPITDEARRLEKLVNDLLLYGRPPAPQPQMIEWAALARELESQAQALANGRPLRVAVSSGIARLRTDPDLLKQILLNLVRNAAEAAAGEIRITAERAGAGLVIAVEDDGPGIPAAVRERLFEPFFTTRASGSGLGLPIARKLATALDARLALKDLAPHGTRAELAFAHLETETGAAVCRQS